MFNNGSVPFTMNVAPTGSANCGGFGNGMWGDGSWVFLIILFALIFGWGNGGWGGYGNGCGQSTSVYEGYVLNNDFSQLSKQISDAYSMTERKLDLVNNGLCDGFYTNAQLINGVNMNIANAQTGITNAITTNGYENRLGQQAIGQQIANCCCDLKQLSGETNYNIATQANMLDRTVSDKFCQTNFNAQTNTRDIIDAQRVDTQAILAKLDSMETNRLREKLEAERDARYALQGQLDRAQLRTDIVNDVRPCPKPSYVVQPPQTVSFPIGCNGYANYTQNSGCGCCGIA